MLVRLLPELPSAGTPSGRPADGAMRSFLSRLFIVQPHPPDLEQVPEVVSLGAALWFLTVDAR